MAVCPKIWPCICWLSPPRFLPKSLHSIGKLSLPAFQVWESIMSGRKRVFRGCFCVFWFDKILLFLRLLLFFSFAFFVFPLAIFEFLLETFSDYKTSLGLALISTRPKFLSIFFSFLHFWSTNAYSYAKFPWQSRKFSESLQWRIHLKKRFENLRRNLV